MNKNDIQSSVKAKVRDSNIELLRIVAMLLVLIVHANFSSIDPPSQAEILSCPLSSFLRSLSESLSIICVNLFILISGWYGIRPRLPRFAALVFQVLFIGLSVYLILFSLDKVESWKIADWINFFTMKKVNWFVACYIMLYICSPVLNVFCENVSQSFFRKFIIVYFAVELFYVHERFIANGCSPLSFAGLYLLARYAKMYPNRLTSLNMKSDIAIYFLTAFLTTVLSIVHTIYTGRNDGTFYGYLSPLAIIGAFYFFLFFTKVNIRNRVINWVAASSFAVYLFHVNTLFFATYYLATIRRWFSIDSTPLFMAKTLLFIVCVFTFSIFLDKIRLLFWNVFTRLFLRCKSCIISPNT